MEPRISIICLGVRDLERSLLFYRDGLGLPTTRRAEDGVIFFQTEGATLELFPYEELARDVSEDFVVPRSKFPGITIAHNVRTREEVDEVLADAGRGRCAHREAGRGHILGWLQGLLLRPGRLPLGGRLGC